VWTGRLGLLHWGDALIDALTDPDDPKVGSIADLYRLSVEDLSSCCSGTKMAKKCHEVLHSNKSVPLELLLAALNIPNLGIATSTDIVHSGHDTVEKVLLMGYDDLLKVPNIGEVTARQVFEGLQGKRDVLQDLSGVLEVRGPSGGLLKGLSFCITGATSRPRKSVQKSILDSGGIVKESVGSGLSYLVTNEDPSFNSSKMQKAKKYGTSVISESELDRMLVHGPNSAPLV
jgi:NAD-dependent DNA ligase